MKYAQIREGIVVELIPETDPVFPGVPITARFSPAFLAECEPVDDTVQLGYKKTISGFTPDPAPAPEPITIDDYRTQAKARLEGYCSGAIYAGTVVACSTARGPKHYVFTEEAQRAISLMAQGTLLGATLFSYRADDEEYNSYTAEEAKALFTAMGNWITICTKYKETLVGWIEQETDEEVLQTIRYGSRPPAALQAELIGYLSALGIATEALLPLLS